MYDLLCANCNKKLGNCSVVTQSESLCDACSRLPVLPVEIVLTLAERIALLESDVVKVTTVMVGKGDLQAKDVAVAVEAGLVEELIKP